MHIGKGFIRGVKHTLMVKAAAMPKATIEAVWDLGGLVSEHWHIYQRTAGGHYKSCMMFS